MGENSLLPTFGQNSDITIELVTLWLRHTRTMGLLVETLDIF